MKPQEESEVIVIPKKFKSAYKKELSGCFRKDGKK